MLVDFEEADYRLNQIIIETLITSFAEAHLSNAYSRSHALAPDMQVHFSKLN